MRMTSMIKPVSLLVFSVLLQAAGSALADECSLQPPRPLLQANAYSHYTFRPATGHRAVESAELRDGLRIEVSSSGCVDFLVREISLIVPARAPTAGHGQNDDAWLRFARTEIGRLKRHRPDDNFGELERFLAEARRIAPRKGTRSVCKDQSTADAGLCSWESMGGFIFKVTRSKGKRRISATKYVSG
jgi:hypothetical protein